MMVQQKLDEYVDGDKKAVIYKYDAIYTVDLFVGGILISKQSSLSEDTAKVVAEQFIGRTRPTLLNENGQ